MRRSLVEFSRIGSGLRSQSIDFDVMKYGRDYCDISIDLQLVG